MHISLYLAEACRAILAPHLELTVHEDLTKKLLNAAAASDLDRALVALP